MDFTVVTENRKKLLAGIAALAVVAVGGLVLTQPDDVTPAEEAAGSAEHGEEGEAVAHGDSVREVAAKANALAVVTGQDIAAVESRWKRALDSLIIMALGG